ncbi:MAG: molybdopterin-guanine dinucleotide biosynthesis protein B [Deltaproteobacteria bacterium]|nr:molybdopterin-guanine dinucleotide biosynthesis protein B [Deltaproteobacteria bacterium]
MLAVCGAKNSGKTTLAVNLVRRLVEAGLKVAAIKRDGHDFEPDVPGTDSFRLRQAGAAGVAVFSPRRFLVTVERPETTFAETAAWFSWADLIVLEGGKNSPFPKIEVVRAAISERPVATGGLVLALATDVPGDGTGPPRLALDDVQGLMELVIDRLGLRAKTARRAQDPGA